MHIFWMVFFGIIAAWLAIMILPLIVSGLGIVALNLLDRAFSRSSGPPR